MKRRVSRGVALALSISIVAVAPSAVAQSRSRIAYQQSGPAKASRSMVVEQMPDGQPMRGGIVSGESFPDASYPDGFAGDGFSEYGYGAPGCCGEGGCSDGCYGGSYGCGDGCCDTCGCSGCDGSCFYRGGMCYSLLGWVCPPGKYYITADYLYVRANFSSAISFLDQQLSENELTS